VSLEGQISRKSAIKSLSDGHQPFGDQIPWKFCEQFQDTVFPTLSGARIVRIATHPSAMKVIISCVVAKFSLFPQCFVEIIVYFVIYLLIYVLLIADWLWFTSSRTIDKVSSSFACFPLDVHVAD
jgi:hypothetical protein